jgi:hypothetical protein
MAVKPMIAPHFPFVDTRTLRSHFELGKSLEAKLRAKLPSPLYFIQPDRKILWNFRLIQDWIFNGDRPEHQRLIEQFLSTLSN